MLLSALRISLRRLQQLATLEKNKKTVCLDRFRALAMGKAAIMYHMKVPSHGAASMFDNLETHSFIFPLKSGGKIPSLSSDAARSGNRGYT